MNIHQSWIRSSLPLLRHPLRRWNELAKAAREEAFSTAGRLRVAIPPCGHRVARANCTLCLQGMGLLAAAGEDAKVGALPEKPQLRAAGKDTLDQL